MKLYYLTTTDPTYNLACEELLAQNAAEPLFMLWRNVPSIIVGCNQNTAAEIDDKFVREHGIRVVRRITGGGAVYHDLGNINYSCVSPGRSWGADSAAQFTAPIVNALNELGIQAEFSGRNDILANGCKISGCARSVPKDHTLFHGTLLFDTNLEILSSALRPDPEKIRSKGIKSVRARVGNIREMLPEAHASMTMDDFIMHLCNSVCRFYNHDGFDTLPSGIAEKAAALAESKYRTWEWNYGTSIPYEVKNRCRFMGGIIQAEFNIRNNRIEALRLTGDFFGINPVAGLVTQLIGLSPKRESLRESLKSIPYQEYIAGITAEALAALLSI